MTSEEGRAKESIGVRKWSCEDGRISERNSVRLVRKDFEILLKTKYRCRRSFFAATIGQILQD